MNRNFLKTIQDRYLKISFVLAMMVVLMLSMVSPGCTPQIPSEKPVGEHPVLPLEPLSPEAYNEKGKMDFKKGAFESAIKHWMRSEELFKAEKKIEPQCRVLVELSRAYQTIGQNDKALEVLENALILAETSGNPYHRAIVMAHLGNMNTLLGNTGQAEHYLQRSRFISKSIENSELEASILNSQGNLDVFKTKYGDAVQAYTKSIAAAKSANNPLMVITALVNGARACLKIHRFEMARELLDEALENLNFLEASHFKAYGLINTGLAYKESETQKGKPEKDVVLLCYAIFKQAREVAEQLNDHRAMSYALGYMGNLYEDEHQYEAALELTQRAAFAAQQVYAPESLYKWQWQAGRLLKQMNQITDAIAAYRRTVFTLQSIRHEVDNCFDIQQASFRKIAGSVCFEMVDLILQQTKTMKPSEEKEVLLLEARDMVELLRVYELRNYFKDDCVDAGGFDTVSLDTISKTAVVVYPVLLEDRTELLVSLPAGLKQFSIPVDRATITREIRHFRGKLEKRTTWEFLPHARILYDYLIRPVEPDLSVIGADTLVFVPSGPLRTVPMAALQDGNEFLIHKYATVITPGLNLIDPLPINRTDLKILAAGVTQAAQGFPPLPEVASELQNISRLFPCKLLLNQAFSISNMERELKKDTFNILHIASHGQFKKDVDHTFVLAFEEKLTMATLDKYAGFLQFRKTPLDLLALSACESAAGDDLAALGMAGVAVKSGARSALASLWFINDMASAILIKQFYVQIKNPSVSRAMALQRAQLSLMADPRYEHPGYWSAFLLINNWL
ncbi:CHAT domain-containing protein [Desulfobacula sp.]|uniref:CHAT domain-containing protein n=1 Tax=Desulfobacula sp. TaxID=2593537 RepID=UPI00260AE79C|nr:CHAT domain-containing protein [Desulfobacula sp.]